MEFGAAPEARGISHPGTIAALTLALVAGTAALAAAAELLPWTGQARPPLELDALDGGGLGLGDFAGRPVLVHFFATWCEPCVEELASLDRLAADRDGGLTVLAVDVGEVDARVLRFFEAHPVSFPVVMDRDRSVTRAWGIVALPSSFVLDPYHAPVGFVEGDLTWDDPAVTARLDALIALPEGNGRNANDNRETQGDDQPT